MRVLLSGMDGGEIEGELVSGGFTQPRTGEFYLGIRLRSDAMTARMFRRSAGCGCYRAREEQIRVM